MIAYEGIVNLHETLYLVLPWMMRGDLRCYLRSPERSVEETFWEKDMVSDPERTSAWNAYALF